VRKSTVNKSNQTRPAAIAINTIKMQDVTTSLREGIADFLHAPLYGIFFGSIYTFAGLLILASLNLLDMRWMIIPIALAFPFSGPFIAVGLYEISRRRAAGIPLKWKEILLVIIAQREGQFGLMAFAIMCIFWIWIAQVRLLMALFLGFRSFASIGAFIEVVTTTPQGLGFLAIGSTIGAVLAFVLFSATVIAIPLLLDRDIDVVTAIITSFQSVFKNLVVMMGWGLIVAILIIIALLPMFFGVIVVLPILGHATWHLFEKVIE
jgi:uncharacterized membrane protein